MDPGPGRQAIMEPGQRLTRARWLDQAPRRSARSAFMVEFPLAASFRKKSNWLTTQGVITAKLSGGRAPPN